MIQYTFWVLCAIFILLLSVEGQRRGHTPMSNFWSGIMCLLSVIQVTNFVMMGHKGPTFIWVVIGLNYLYQYLTNKNFSNDN